MLHPLKSKLILNDPKKTTAALFLIKIFFKNLSRGEDIDSLLNLVEIYANYQSNSNFRLTSVIYRELFYVLNKFNRSEQGYLFFSRVSETLDKSKFYNTKSYAVYFAYQLKQYDLIGNTINSFFIEIPSEFYAEAYDFCMMNFYKGLIFLSEKKFNKASISFLSVFKVLPSHNVFTHFHIDSMKRLILLSFLVDNTIENYLSQVIENNKSLLIIKPLEIYAAIYNKCGDKSVSLKEIEAFIRDNMNSFKSEKTCGLVKICLREIIFNRISHVLKPYKRIYLDKLSKIVEIEKSALINHLKDFNRDNKLNVHLDVVNQIVHVLNHRNEEVNSLDELKVIHENIISVENDLRNLFNKNQSSKIKNEDFSSFKLSNKKKSNILIINMNY